MAHRAKLTQRKRKMFFEALRTGQSVTAACALICMARRTMYDHREADEAFRQEWEDAIEAGTDLLEDEALKRATTDKSDTLLMFLLNGRRPEKFKRRHEHTGKDGAPIEGRFTVKPFTDEALSRLSDDEVATFQALTEKILAHGG